MATEGGRLEFEFWGTILTTSPTPVRNYVPAQCPTEHVLDESASPFCRFTISHFSYSSRLSLSFEITTSSSSPCLVDEPTINLSSFGFHSENKQLINYDKDKLYFIYDKPSITSVVSGSLSTSLQPPTSLEYLLPESDLQKKNKKPTCSSPLTVGVYQIIYHPGFKKINWTIKCCNSLWIMHQNVNIPVVLKQVSTQAK